MRKSNRRSSAFSGNKRTRLQPPELVSVPKRLLAGKSTVIRIEEGSPEKQIQDFFHMCGADGTLEQLRGLCAPGDGLVGINFGFTEKSYQYAVAAPVQEEPASSCPLERFAIDGGEFARFNPGGMSCHDAWREIYNDWLPNAHCRYRMAQELECYGEDGPLFANTLWVPIERPEQKPQPKEHKTGRLFSGQGICAALCAVAGIFLTFDSGVPWLGALLGYAAGHLAFALFKRLRKE